MELEAVQTVAIAVAGDRSLDEVLRCIVEGPRGLPARRRARPHLAGAPRLPLRHLPHTTEPPRPDALHRCDDRRKSETRGVGLEGRPDERPPRNPAKRKKA